MAETMLLRGAHFQLTGRCNLHCRFCGQSKGMLAAGESELPVETWLRLAREVRALADTPEPEVTLGGGEPLLYSGFPRLARRLKEEGFRVAAVTNGTLIDRMPELLCEYPDVIHLSIDGFGAVHDAVRGSGVFDRVRRNLELIRERRGKLIFLTTVSDANVAELAELPEQLAELGPDEIVLQQLMYLTPAEIAAYRKFSVENFGCDYPELEAWRREDDAAYLAMLRRQLAALAKRSHPVPVRFTPHSYPDRLPDAPACRAPFRRVHIRHDGAVGFCTDYFGFSAGNVKELPLEAICRSPAAERYRAGVRSGELPICDHCPWRLQQL